MAYPHIKYEIYKAEIVNQNLAAATGDKAFWSPMYVPHYVRAVGVVITTSCTGTGVVDFDFRPTQGSDTNRVSNGGIARINLLTTAQGKTIYKDGLNQLVIPGNEVVIKLTTAAGAGNGTPVLYVEPSWERPLNNTNMVLTT